MTDFRGRDLDFQHREQIIQFPNDILKFETLGHIMGRCLNTKNLALGSRNFSADNYETPEI